MRTNHTQHIAAGWVPAFEEAPTQHHINRKTERSNKLARDMQAKVRARRAEDQHILELAEYFHPFMEA